jgi:hypothetical protein
MFNQDVVYGMGYASLDEEPVVMQVPDFGDRFWVYAAWDARTDSFAELGKQYGTRPGFYLLIGPELERQRASRYQQTIPFLHRTRRHVPRCFFE